MKHYWAFLVILWVFCIIYSPSATAQTDRPLNDYPIITADNVSQLEQLKVLGEGYIRQVIFSPDEQLVAMATSVGIWLYAADDLQNPVRLFGDYEIDVTYVMFNADSSRLFGGVQGGSVYIWDVASGEKLMELRQGLYGYNHFHTISYLQLSSDEKHLYSHAQDLWVWNLEIGYVERIIDNTTALSPDGELLIREVSHMGKWRYAIAGTETGEIHYFLSEDIVSPHFDESSQYIVAIKETVDGAALIWDAQTGELLHIVGENSIGHKNNYQVYAKPSQDNENFKPSIDGAILSQDHTKIITFNTNFSFCVWEVTTNNFILSSAGEEYCVMSFENLYNPPWSDEIRPEIRQFIHDENLLSQMTHYFQINQTNLRLKYNMSNSNKYFSLNTDISLTIWNTETGDVLLNKPSEEHCASRGTARIAINSMTLITKPLTGGNLCIWDIEDEKLVSVISSQLSSNFSTDGQYIVTINPDSEPLEKIAIWDLEKNTMREFLYDVVDFGYSVLASFTPNNEYLVLAHTSGQVFVFDIETTELIHEFSTQWFNSLVVSPDSQWISVTYSLTSGMSVWNLVTGEEQSVDGSYPVFSPTGKYLASLSDNTLYIWDLENNRLFFEVSDEFNTFGFGDRAFSFDESFIAFVRSISPDEKWVSIFDLQLKEEVARLPIHTNWRQSYANLQLDFSPYENLLAISGNRLQFWTPRGDDLLGGLTNYQGIPLLPSMYFINEGSLIVEELGDGVIRIWGINDD